MPESPLPPQSAPIGSDTDAVSWMRGQADRAWEATKYVEKITRPNRAERAASVPGAIWLRKALTGSAIPVATAGGATPGSGTVTFCDFVSGSWVSNGNTVTAYNPSTSATVAGATYVTLGFVGGVWEVVLEPCP